MTKIFLAGNMSGQGRQVAEREMANGYAPPYALSSYWYCRDDTSFDAMFFLNRHKTNQFFLDSGAYTFMDEVSKDPSNIDFGAYVEQYADFINKHNISHFFEMDIDNVVGLHRVRQLRDRLEQRTGQDCIPVFHKSRGKEAFLKLVEEYDRVAVGGIVAGEFSDAEHKYFEWFTETAHEHDTAIHGLGFTPSHIGVYGFDSVDSTSWLSGNRYGHIYVFNGSTLEQKSRDGRAKYPECVAHNLTEWVKYARYMDGR